MNYIFVDIDGPLLPGKSYLFPENNKLLALQPKKFYNVSPKFDQFGVKVHNLLAKYSNAKIVLSTTWAVHIGPNPIKRIMEENGLEFDYHDQIVTPKYSSRSEHCADILDWIDEHGEPGSKFIAIDDQASLRYLEQFQTNEAEKTRHYGKMLMDKNISGKWIKVDFQDGMTMQNFNDAVKFLDIDMDELNFKEFGIIPLTNEEKAQRKKDLDMLIGCMI